MLIQNPFDSSVADQFSLPLSDVAAVAQRDFLKSSITYLGEECSQTFRENDVRLKLEILLMRNRRHVDGILNHAVFQIVFHLLGDLHTHRFLRFVGRSATM